MSPSTYRPIACSLHDQLLHYATVREVVDVVAILEDKEERFSSAIEDVFTRDHAEFARFANGSVVRLDHLVSVAEWDFRTDGFCAL